MRVAIQAATIAGGLAMKCPACNGSGEIEFCSDKQNIVNNITVYVEGDVDLDKIAAKVERVMAERLAKNSSVPFFRQTAALSEGC
jgi:hypothetical protein